MRLIKSLSSTQESPASNQGTADTGSPQITASNSESLDEHELSKQRVLSWLNDTAEPQRLYRPISAWESIEARIAAAQEQLDTLDTAVMNYSENKARRVSKPYA
jgi:hypothetical protein